MPQTAEQRLHHRLVAEEVVPLAVAQVRGDDGGMPVITLLHELEEGVRLFGLEVQIPEFVDQQDVEAREMVDQLAGGAVGERSVHLVEQILRANELAAQPVLQSLEQDAAGQSGFPHAGGAGENQILVFGHEIEFGKGLDLLALYAGLTAVRESFQRPTLREIGAANAPLQSALLAVMPLGAEQRGDELRVGDLLFLGGAQLLVVDRAHAAELEILQQLFDLVSHRGPPAGSIRASHGAELCARRGPDRTGHSGWLLRWRRERLRADSRAAGAAAAATAARSPCVRGVSGSRHKQRSRARRPAARFPPDADRAYKASGPAAAGARATSRAPDRVWECGDVGRRGGGGGGGCG